MPLEFSMSLAIKPKGQGRPRFAGHAYTPKATREYANAIRATAKHIWGDRDPLTGPLQVNVWAHFALPKTAKDRGLHHTQRPDADNVAKAVLDALMPEFGKRKGERVQLWGGVIADDAQVCDLRCKKQWSVIGNSLDVTIWSV